MTTQVVITNIGPDELLMRSYKKDRSLSNSHVRIGVGKSETVTVHDDNLPVMWAVGGSVVVSDTNQFFAIPPARF